jgi:hypothetical protein
MDQYELAERAYALPGRFADRLDPTGLATVREYAEVGEWGRGNRPIAGPSEPHRKAFRM